MGEVIGMSGQVPLHKTSVVRVPDDPHALKVNFNRAPTEEEMRMIEDFMDMMVNQSGVMNMPQI